ncbi:hypothetical protein ABZ128_09540 [Streptomyces sp. NPDC006326]|uniref:hypothetical protein n=1 Tax=Streptomyces sp. NPDC006326 TaxID=3156752 RepID=UPI0033AEB246
MSVRIETADEAQKRRECEAVAALVGAVLLLPLEAWALMVVIGALHGLFAPVALVGYGTAVLLVLGIDLTAHMSRKFRTSK